MKRYKFDGERLKEGGRTIANVRRDHINEGTGSRTVANVDGDRIREGHGSKIMFNVHRGYICQGSGSKRIASMDDVHDSIDGPGDVVKAALWLYFVR